MVAILLEALRFLNKCVKKTILSYRVNTEVLLDWRRYFRGRWICVELEVVFILNSFTI